MSTVCTEKGLGNERGTYPKMAPARPLSRVVSPSVMMTRVSSGARSTGRITMRWITMPPANAITNVAGNAIQ
jgi:hypothetical protein